jgi:hypothetical protein
MTSKRELEGYFMMDHRHTSPVPEALLVATKMPPNAGRGLFEAPSYTCSHCQRQVIVNPSRTHERAYCRGCDHYICDECGAIRARTLECKTFKQIIDETLTAAELNTRR